MMTEQKLAHDGWPTEAEQAAGAMPRFKVLIVEDQPAEVMAVTFACPPVHHRQPLL